MSGWHLVLRVIVDNLLYETYAYRNGAPFI